MSIAWEDVTAFASELSEVDENAQDDIVAYVNETLDPAKLGGEGSQRLRMARIYLAAHLGAMVDKGANGPAIMEMEGPVSRQYKAFTSGATLHETAYGRRYAEILRGSLARAPFVL